MTLSPYSIYCGPTGLGTFLAQPLAPDSSRTRPLNLAWI